MKISAAKMDGFIAAPPPGIRGVLVYGPDSGLVRERAGKVLKAVIEDTADPFAVEEIPPPVLNNDPVRLVDEVLAVSFSGGRRGILVRDAGDDIVGAVEMVLQNDAARDPSAALVIITAGNLTPRSALRRQFESSGDCVALACYPDDAAGLDRLLRSSFTAAGITADAAAVQAGASLLGSNRQANRQEIEKLILYAGLDRQLTEQMVASCLGDSSEASVDAAILAAADGDYDDLGDQLARVWADGTEPVAVIRAAQRHFQRLHFVRAQTAAGTALESAVKQLRPPLFWRVAGRFRAQLAAWSLAALEASLARLTDAELSVKSTGTPATLVCDRALLSIAQRARSERRSRY